jgi:hypothetical protein
VEQASRSSGSRIVTTSMVESNFAPTLIGAPIAFA